MSDLLFKATDKPHIISQFPEPVAYLYFSKGFCASLYKKPNWFHRMMIKWFFGWEIKDNLDTQLLKG